MLKKTRTHSHLKNILWLSWRDIKNPDSGGAEKVAIEAASRFVRDQIPVTIFSSHFANDTKQEKIRGVKIIRRGGLITCRLFAFLYYIRRAREFDLIIDEINTIPFFSIFYAKHKTITLIHQLAREYWFTQTIWPISLIGFWLEPFWLRLYRSRPTLALSVSTKADLVNLGFTNVKIYQIGLDFKPQLVTKKENLILYIGRLIPAKGPQDAICAFGEIKNVLPKFRLIVAGKGKSNFIKSLKKLASNLKLENSVKFAGFVPQPTKINLLKKSKIVLIPSVREGWCLVATEANALGCIPIGYNVPGLKNSIKSGYSGLLTKNNTHDLAQAATSILQNQNLRLKLIENGILWSKKFTWKNCYLDFKSFISKYHN